MKFYSTNNRREMVSLREAVVQGLAPDNGLYMPEHIPKLPATFFDALPQMSFKEIAKTVAAALLEDEVPAQQLENIIDHTIQFDAPLVQVEADVFALELFHGPTLAFKDFGARFMSQLLGYFAAQEGREITILVATSGDTGSAVANGFFGVPGTRVVVLYPKGKVSDIQEKQFTTLGGNVMALEVEGTFDDCQALVKQAFLDRELKKQFFLTSANSINISRLIPQSFYYFRAVAQLENHSNPVVFSVPSGNFGNLTGGLLAKRMGLPIHRFIAATNVNDVVPAYLQDKIFQPRASKHTISNAMDVGNPSNFVRLLDLYGGKYDQVVRDIVGYGFTDQETAEVMQSIYASTGYVLDPHGAIGYLGLKRYRERSDDVFQGIFLETAHPGKFKEVVDRTLAIDMQLPSTLQKFLEGKKETWAVQNDYGAFRSTLKNLLR